MGRGQRLRRRARLERQNRRPATPPTPGGDHQVTSLVLLPDKQAIYDWDGVLVTDDMDGWRRPVEDVYREVISNLRTRPGDPPPLVLDDYMASGKARLAPQQTATPGPRPSPLMAGRDYQRRFLPGDREISAYYGTLGELLTDDHEREDRAPNVFASKELLDTTITTASSLPQPTSSEDIEPNVLASKELLDITTREKSLTTLEESSITNASSLPQPTLREDRAPNVLASKELLDTTTLESSITTTSSLPQPTPREDRAPNVFASKELLDTTTLEESSITSASSLLQPTSPKEELIPTPQLLQALDKARASFHLWRTQQPSGSGYAYHYLALHEPDMLSSKELSIVRATLGKSSITDASYTRAEAVTHSPTPPISARKPAGWNHQFFIREDRGFFFHTYPELGGPFQSLEEAEKAILCRLDKLRDPKMCTNNGLSRSEIAIRKALYWPDGKRKHSSRSNPDEDHMGLLVQALLDKYNEENNLLEDLAYQVKDVVSFQEVYEGDGGWYYHLNCTRKTKDGVDNLFFAEVLKMTRGGLDEFKLTCLHMVEPVDNGPCYGCTNNDIGMKHPIDAGKYKGGHDPSWPRGSCCYPRRVLPKDMHARMKYEEERIRYIYRDRDVAKLDGGTRTAAGTRTDACSDKSQGRRVQYIVPARRQLV